MLEAAADTWFNVRTSKRGHFAQLPRDLDSFVKQQTELSLVTCVACRRYLTEEICEGIGQRINEGDLEMREEREMVVVVVGGGVQSMWVISRRKDVGINRWRGRKSDGMAASGRKSAEKCVNMRMGGGTEDAESTRGTDSFLIFLS